MRVYFIGAGPGDPELLTLRGKRIIESCPVVIYAGSLVSTEILSFARRDAEIHDSAKLSLDDKKIIYERARDNGHDVARIHSGDPCIYGAINEQFRVLDELKIEYEVVPGVSSFQAAAAALKTEFTAPEVCQSITLSRVAGRTPVPEKESLENLAGPRPTLVLFLSIGQLSEIIERLSKKYEPDTPAAIVYRVTWPDEKIIRGTLATIMEKMSGEKISKSALIIVGEALHNSDNVSKLYDAAFAHGYRKKK